MLAELELDVEVWVDDLGDTSRATFGDLPSWAVMINRGTIARKLAWPTPESLQAFVKDLPPPDQPNVYPPARVRANRIKISLERAAALRTAPPGELAPAKTVRLHERRAHLAFLIEAAPEHASRDEWLRELSADGPAHQRAWALTRGAATEVEPKRDR